MSFNYENVQFLKHLACELKVVQNGSIKGNLWIFSKFPVLETDLDKPTFILYRKRHCICDCYWYASIHWLKIYAIILTCSVALWALKYFWEMKWLQQKKLELHLYFTMCWHTRMSEQATLGIGNTLPMLVGPSVEAKNPTERQGTLVWLQRCVRWPCCFPCKYYSIQSSVQHLEVMQHCVAQTCSHSLNSERTAIKFLLRICKK